MTDVLVSPSSVVTEVCDGFSSGSDCLLNRSPFLSPKSARWCVLRIKEEELPRVASECASEYQKKDDAAHATANFVFFN